MYGICRVDADRWLIARIKLDLSVSGSDDENQNLFIIYVLLINYLHYIKHNSYLT